MNSTVSSIDRSMRPPSIPVNWSPRGHVSQLNDYLHQGRYDRPGYWNNFVNIFWSESPAAIKLKFGLTGEEYDLPTAIIAHFFATWHRSTSMMRLQITMNQVNEGLLPAGFPFLTSPVAMIETTGLDGSLLVRQHLATRILFDPLGKIIQWEWQIMAHDEYFLSLQAENLLTFNFPQGLEGHPFICRWGFPMGVHRVLDLYFTLKELVDGRTDLFNSKSNSLKTAVSIKKEKLKKKLPRNSQNELNS